MDLVQRLRAAGCVLAEDEAALLLASTDDPEQLEERIRRRVGGEPLEQVLGWAAFMGLRLHLEPGVFVPRHRSEALVREAAALVPPGGAVLDLCCGTGALGAALAALVPGLRHVAADLDPAAVRCARRNAPGEVHEGDLFDALPHPLRFDVIIANAPYVPSAAVALLPAEFRDHERRAALDGGDDGLDLQRRVIAEAPAWLVPGGALLVETSAEQEPATLALMASAGLAAGSRHLFETTVAIGRA
ncbi:putative protein N(5)-glutamine methyltransferase [Arenivirga flava]|uniref:peptide chain release factor N(5)-glutamine methyltransferase n=1 Tax=Arenivirga flava TaxID=1930060 RepID=A0AA37XCP7_9MICO|nr:putative protein N(5)-glutamine methyltransferase [Arenivirga flava]GMA28592.1 methylase [Arenivirga flava]